MLVRNEKSNPRAQEISRMILWGMLMLLATVFVALYLNRDDSELLKRAAAKTEIKHPTNPLIVDLVDRLQRTDLLRMRSGKIYFVVVMGDQNAELQPCVECEVETWSKRQISENIDWTSDMIHFADQGWHAALSQWAFQKE